MLNRDFSLASFLDTCYYLPLICLVVLLLIIIGSIYFKINSSSPNKKSDEQEVSPEDSVEITRENDVTITVHLQLPCRKYLLTDCDCRSQKECKIDYYLLFSLLAITVIAIIVIDNSLSKLI
jgi:hypothetical protein